MAGLCNADKIKKQSLYDIGYEYLCNNFHKFKESNKIKIAIAILNIFEKDDSKTKSDIRQIVVMNDIIKNDKPVRYNLGQANSAGDAENPGQVGPNTDQPG